MDQVNKLADVAGILHRKGMVQSLNYSLEWMKEDYKLLELPKELMSILRQGDSVTIRGGDDDDAVLCTNDQTYDLKTADTSNALLLLPELLTPKCEDFSQDAILAKKSVLSCFSSYYEVRQTRPKLERLRHLLDDNAYSDKTDEENVEKHNTDGLLNLIQASEAELLKSLKDLNALQIDGYWRVLDISYQEKAFSQILALVEEKCWDWKKIPINETCEVLEELYWSFVLKHCLNTYGDMLEPIESSDVSEDMYCLDEVKVCKYYAEYILRHALGKFNYHEFMEAWAQSVPGGMTIKEDYLLGIALTDLTSHPPVIWHFPERNLPHNPNDRFNLLFKTRTKWKETDIEPYVKNLVGPGQKLSSLYLKFTRSSKDEQGNKMYNSKKPVV